MTRYYIKILLFIALLLGMSCANKSEFPSNSIHIQLPSEPVSLDPSLAEDGISLRILSNLRDGLIRNEWTSRGVRQVGVLADSWKVSNQGKRYEFKLKAAIKWEDGKPVFASDFIRTLKKVINPKSKSKLIGFLNNIKGVKEYRLGKIKFEEVGISILKNSASRESLRFDLMEPQSGFLQIVTLPPFFPTREDQESLVNGPYYIEKHVSDQFYILKPNPNSIRYIEGSQPIVLRIITDENTAVTLFEKNRIHVLSRVAQYDLKRLDAKGLIKTDPMIATYYLGFNLKKPPFNDLKYRKALKNLIHREELVQLLGTGEKPATGIIPPPLDGALDFSPELTQAVKSFDSIPVTLGFDSSSRNNLLMERIKKHIETGSNLKITLKNQDWKSYVGSLSVDAPQIYRFAWLAPFSDSLTHLQGFTSSDPNNYTGWKNSHYDQLITDISRLEFGSSLRLKKLYEAQKILTQDEVVIIPLYHYVLTHAVSAQLVGFSVDPLGIIDFSKLFFRIVK